MSDTMHVIRVPKLALHLQEQRLNEIQEVLLNLRTIFREFEFTELTSAFIESVSAAGHLCAESVANDSAEKSVVSALDPLKFADDASVFYTEPVSKGVQP